MKNKKIKIILLSIALLILIIILFSLYKEKEIENYAIYHCNIKIEGGTETENDYKVYYDEESNEVVKQEIIKTYKLTDPADKDSFSTLKYLIATENKDYVTYSGIRIKILKNNMVTYSQKITVDVSKIKDEYLSIFEISKTIKEAKEYFSSINNIVCE